MIHRVIKTIAAWLWNTKFIQALVEREMREEPVMVFGDAIDE